LALDAPRPSSPPFALSLSKGFDKLSLNGAGLINRAG